MSDPDKPVLKEIKDTCPTCGKPVFPSKSGTASAMLYRPGFCSCQLKNYVAQVNGQQAKQVEQKQEEGHVLKIPHSAQNQPEPAQRRHFDPLIDLKDLVESGFTFYDRVGKGSLGYVYQARSKNIEALLAVKIFHRKIFENKRTLKRLEQEAMRARELSHANLAAVYHFGISAKNYPYLVMDFLAGPSLAELLKQEGFLDVPRVIDIFIQVAEALHYAHEEKMLHRDLKPSNIYLLKATGGKDFVKVSDLGLAKVLPNPGRETKYMTPDGEEFGNPSYMSPEQCLGEKLTPASDLYGLGCVMYECLSGKLPLSSSNPVRLAFKQVSEKPRSLNARFSDLDIPEDLNNVVMCLLEKSKDARYSTAKEVAVALTAIRDGQKPKLPKAPQTQKNANSHLAAKDKNSLSGKLPLGFLSDLLDKVKKKK